MRMHTINIYLPTRYQVSIDLLFVDNLLIDDLDHNCRYEMQCFPCRFLAPEGARATRYKHSNHRAFASLWRRLTSIYQVLNIYILPMCCCCRDASLRLSVCLQVHGAASCTPNIAVRMPKYRDHELVFFTINRFVYPTHLLLTCGCDVMKLYPRVYDASCQV